MKKSISLLILVSMLMSCLFALPTVAAESTEGEGLTIGEATEVLPIIKGTEENMLKNGNFEEIAEDGSLAHWASRSGWGEELSAPAVEKEDVFEGKTALSITPNETYGSAFVSQVINLMPRAFYQLSYWTKNNYGDDGSSRVKLEFMGDPTLPGAGVIAEHNTTRTYDTNDEWVNVLYNFQAPATAYQCTVLVRRMGTAGTSLFDDAKIYMVQAPPMCTLSTDCVFYYPDQTEGTAKSSFLFDFYPELEGGSVAYAIKDGNKVLLEKKGLPIEKNVEWTYSLDVLKEKQKEYTLHVSVRNKQGKELFTDSTFIYKYDRPQYLSKEGIYQAEGEEPFKPVFGYRLDEQYYDPYALDMGITVAQYYADRMDTANAVGIKGFYPVYVFGNPPGGYDTTLDWIADIVETHKDDPSVFAWGIADEPFLQQADPADALRQAYITVRNIDDKHPVYLCAATNYEEAAKYCDILGIDPYVSGGMRTDIVGTRVRAAVEATKGLKPVIDILQSYDSTLYYPDARAERYMVQDAFRSGASGIGYYSVCRVAPALEDGTQMHIFNYEKGDLWEGVQDIAKKDLDLNFEHFVFKDLPGFNSFEDEAFGYHSYVKDNFIYCQVYNKSLEDTITAEVPLTSFDGKIKVQKFTAEYYSGGEDKNQAIRGADGILRAEILPYQCITFKIKADVSLKDLDNDAFWQAVEEGNASGVPRVEITDLAEHEWAKEAVDALIKEEIVNTVGEGLYAPGENVTRADFAMFFIRALLKTGKISEEMELVENFDDVAEDAPYAKELQIGRTLGILNGYGDGNYGPDAPITRQDLMKICGGGLAILELAEEPGDLSGFSDIDLIAEYAKDAAAVMVGMGFIQGNADGTLNPLGNTTRAEAAVMTNRVFEKYR